MQLSSGMNFFYLCPDDLHWLKHWLSKHISLLVLIAGFWLLVQAWPKAEAPKSRNAANSDNVVLVDRSADLEPPIPPVENADHTLPKAWVDDGPQGIRLTQMQGRQLVSVAPTGWRRARNGWENTANWRPTLASLGDIIRRQQEREPTWLRNVFSQIRGVPPWGVAIFQIVAVVVVLSVSGRKTDNPSAGETNSV